ncbi:MAG: hypothetical protein ACAI25_09525 [Planctomycetota bacterium]
MRFRVFAASAAVVLVSSAVLAQDPAENWKQIEELIAKANEHLKDGRNEDVIKTVQKILEATEKPTNQSPATVKHLRATCYMARSKACAALKKIEAALINFEKYCDLEPDLNVIENDKGFDPIRNEERFKAAVAKARKASPPAPSAPTEGPKDPKAAENLKAIQEHANKLDAAYNEGRFADALDEAKAILERLEQPSGLPAPNQNNLRAICFVMASGSFSALKNVEKALDTLEKALELGYRNLAALERDKNFDAIREHERFKAAIEKAQSAAPAPAPAPGPAPASETKARENLKKLQGAIVKVDPALKAEKFEEALEIETECLALLEAGTGLPAPNVRHLMALGNFVQAVCYGALKKPEPALDCFEKAMKLGFRQWGALEDKNLDAIREHPRFKNMIARIQSAQSLDDEKSMELVEEDLSVGELGGATVKMRISMSPKAYAGFKVRVSPFHGFEEVDGTKFPKLGEPSARAVLNSLDIATMPVELRKLAGQFDDASNSFAAQYTILGLAKNTGGRWKLPLTDSERWEMKVAGEVVSLVTQDLVFGRVVERRMKLSLPKGANGIELERRPNRLVYRLPAYQAPATQENGQPEFRLEAKPYITSALYKLYGDPRFSKFWAARSVFRNNSKDTLTNFRVRFRVTDYSSWSPWERCDNVYPSQTVVDAFYPVIDSKVKNLKAATPAVIEVEYEYERNGKKVTSGDSARLRLLGMNAGVSHSGVASYGALQTWYEFRSDSRELIASFVCGDDPVMHEVVGMLQHHLGGTWSNHSDKDAKKFLEALYHLLCTNVAYQGARGLEESGEHGQDYKYGRDTLRTKTGTCINLAIFFASVCEAAGFEPTIFLIEGHAFPGVRLPESKETCFVETTGCGGGTPGSATFTFDMACRVARIHYASALEQRLIIPIDVKQLRAQGVTPPELPDPGKNFIKEWGIKPPEEAKPGHEGKAEDTPK